MSRAEFDAMLDTMVRAGVFKIVGQKMECGRLVPVYDAVPPEEWPPEGWALMMES